jgi:putative protease
MQAPVCGTSDATARLSVLCRTLEQVEAAVTHGGVDTIYTDFEDVRVHREARGLVPAGGPRFAPCTLRITKPGEAGIVRKLLESGPDAVLVRNLAAWQVLRHEAPDLPLLGDYALNVANDLTARLLVQAGLRQLTPSYDLNADQLMDLLAAAPANWFEVTVHQHLPMFHMEHCVFCRFLSTGTDWTNCGRPCETHSLALRDRMGYEHPVKADAGCRNTVYNAVAQSASEYLGAMRTAGVRRFRIEFLNEDGRTVREAIDRYLPVIHGEGDGRALWRDLRAISKLGVTRGSLDHD